jgi:hypothetical protein
MNKEQIIYQALVEEYGTGKLNELRNAVEKDRNSQAFPLEGDFENWVVGYAISSVVDLMEEFDVDLE